MRDTHIVIDVWIELNFTEILFKSYKGDLSSSLTVRTLGKCSAINAVQMIITPTGSFKKWNIHGLSDTRAQSILYIAVLPASAQSQCRIPSRNYG